MAREPADQPGGGRVVYAPDGGRLAVGTEDGTVSVLDSGSGRLLAREQVDSFGGRALHWPTEESLLQGGQDGVFRVLDPQSLSVVRELPLSPEVNLTDIQAAGGSGRVLAASEDGYVRPVDPAGPELLDEPLSADGTQLQSVAPSPDGRWIAVVSRDGAPRLWDRDSGRAVGPPLAAHEVQTVGIEWLDDDTLVHRVAGRHDRGLGHVARRLGGPRVRARRSRADPGRVAALPARRGAPPHVPGRLTTVRVISPS